MSDLALFDAAPYTVLPSDEAPGEQLSQGRRRTIRHAQQLAKGLHPVALRPLHPDAAPADDRQAEGLRCKDCVFRVVLGHHNRTYPKCTHPVVTRDDEPIHPADYDRMPRVSHGAASDVRGWWPACADYKPQEAPSARRGRRPVETVAAPGVLS